VNTEWVFRSRKLALRSLAVFTSLYVFIYVLLRVEAYALLVGAIASFAAVAAAMYVTRNVDWYGVSTPVPSFAAGSSTSAPRKSESWLD
jgi:inner membrane protein involved in colicin E2 resistance